MTAPTMESTLQRLADELAKLNQDPVKPETLTEKCIRLNAERRAAPPSEEPGPDIRPGSLSYFLYKAKQGDKTAIAAIRDLTGVTVTP